MFLIILKKNNIINTSCILICFAVQAFIVQARRRLGKRLCAFYLERQARVDQSGFWFRIGA